MVSLLITDPRPKWSLSLKLELEQLPSRFGNKRRKKKLVKVIFSFNIQWTKKYFE